MAAAKGWMGRMREKLGWLTADRKEEARGRLEQADAAGLTPDDSPTDETSVKRPSTTPSSTCATSTATSPQA